MIHFAVVGARRAIFATLVDVRRPLVPFASSAGTTNIIQQSTIVIRLVAGTRFVIRDRIALDRIDAHDR